MNPTWPQTLAGVIVTSAAVLAAIGYLARKAKQMWITSRKAGVFFDQVLGDKTANPPVPSLIEKVDAIKRQLDKHLEEHRETSQYQGPPVREPQQNRRRPRP